MGISHKIPERTFYGRMFLILPVCPYDHAAQGLGLVPESACHPDVPDGPGSCNVTQDYCFPRGNSLGGKTFAADPQGAGGLSALSGFTRGILKRY